MEYKSDPVGQCDQPIPLGVESEKYPEIKPDSDLKLQSQEFCTQYVNSFRDGNYIEANKYIVWLHILIKEQVKPLNVDFSLIIDSLIKTQFLDVILDIIHNRDIDYLPNVIELIALFTYFSTDFSTTLFHSDILLHFIGIFLESDGFELTKHSEYNLFIAIRNLIELVPNKDYSFFDEFNFIELIEKMKCIEDFFFPGSYAVISKFLLSLISNAGNMAVYYPYIIQISESILSNKSFPYVLLYCEKIIHANHSTVSLIFNSFLDNIATVYQTHNEDCYDYIKYYYSFLTEVVRYFDYGYESEQADLFNRIDKIKNAIPMDDDNNLLAVFESDDNSLILVGLRFVSIIMSKNQFDVFFELNQVPVVDGILKLLTQESSFDVILKAFELAFKLLQLDYEKYSEIINDISPTIYSSFIYSRIPEYQLLALHFLHLILQTKNVIQSPLEYPTAKSLAWNIVENKDDCDLYEELNNIITDPSESPEEVVELAKKVLLSIRFYTDSPYD